MSFDAKIEVSDSDVQKLLAVEYKDLKKPRFSVSMKDSQIIIKAKDIKAFKAIVSSIIQRVEIFEKMRDI